jgi:hypothetical protein
MSMLPDDSPTPPRALRANEEYIRVRLMPAHLPYTCRFLTSCQPLVYAGVGLGEAADDTAEFAEVVSSGRSAIDARWFRDAEAHDARYSAPSFSPLQPVDGKAKALTEQMLPNPARHQRVRQARVLSRMHARHDNSVNVIAAARRSFRAGRGNI